MKDLLQELPALVRAVLAHLMLTYRRDHGKYPQTDTERSLVMDRAWSRHTHESAHPPPPPPQLLLLLPPPPPPPMRPLRQQPQLPASLPVAHRYKSKHSETRMIDGWVLNDYGRPMPSHTGKCTNVIDRSEWPNLHQPSGPILRQLANYQKSHLSTEVPPPPHPTPHQITARRDHPCAAHT